MGRCLNGGLGITIIDHFSIGKEENFTYQKRSKSLKIVKGYICHYYFMRDAYASVEFKEYWNSN